MLDIQQFNHLFLNRLVKPNFPFLSLAHHHKVC